MTRYYRYVPHLLIDDYLRMGWMLAPIWEAGHMDHYRMTMMWLCKCPVAEPK
jgi:hypothetical protein